MAVSKEAWEGREGRGREGGGRVGDEGEEGGKGSAEGEEEREGLGLGGLFLQFSSTAQRVGQRGSVKNTSRPPFSGCMHCMYVTMYITM